MILNPQFLPSSAVAQRGLLVVCWSDAILVRPSPANLINVCTKISHSVGLCNLLNFDRDFDFWVKRSFPN